MKKFACLLALAALMTTGTLSHADGPEGGVRTGTFVVRPNQVLTLDPIVFVGRQRAIVHVDLAGGLPDSNMVLEVFDEFGNRVRVDNVPGNYFRCEWTPAFTGPFTVRLTNRDAVSFTCRFTVR